MIENKVNRYLLYAFGEILLVVIGILIALQVNNWNEERKQLTKEKELLTYVLESIRTDSLITSNILLTIDEITKVHTDIFAVSTGELAPEEVVNLDMIRRSIPNSVITKTNNPNLPQEVRDQSLKKEIQDYYLAIDGANYSFNNNDALIEQKIRPFLGEKNLLNYGSQLITFSEQENLVNSEKFFLELRKPELQQVLFEAGIKLSSLKNSFDRLAVQNEQIKKLY